MLTPAFAKNIQSLPIPSAALMDQSPVTCLGSVPVTEVSGISYYIDAKGSVVDPDRAAENNRRTAPLKRFLADINKLADTAVRNGSIQSRRCALQNIRIWAEGGALMRTDSLQATAERNIAIGGLAFAVMKLRAGDRWSNDDHSDEQSIEKWLGAVVAQVRPRLEGIPPERWGNLESWYTLFVMTTAILLDDRALFEASVTLGERAVSRIAEDGLLPSEVRRGSRAMEYHYFGLTPIVFIAELAAVNGVDLYVANNSAIHRLVKRLVEISENIDQMERLAGAAQNTSGRPTSPAGLAWVVPYTRRFPALGPVNWIKGRFSLIEPRLGGDVFNLFPTLELR
jgi:poly(beta-D-mannuronate) lyase